MADIFVSYKSEDRDRVAPFVEAFEHQGWSVWWDREIRPGATWDDTIESEVTNAQCIVVFWSTTSIESRWVKNEAMAGLEGDKLVPVLLDVVTIPIAFKATQAADLTADDATAGLNRVVSAVAELLGRTHLPVAQAKKPGHARRWLAIATSIALGAVLWGWSMLDETPGPNIAAAHALVDLSRPVPGFDGTPAIAIMPFLNRSLDPEGALFAQGLSNDIANGLARFQMLPVISATATQVYQGQNPDLRQVAKDVGAGYVITGDVRRTQGEFRVNAQLVDASGRTVWSDQLSGSIDEFFAVQDQITEQIIGTILPQYVRAEGRRATRSQPSNLSAWLEFVQGWELMFDSTRTAEGEAHCRRAIELDPSLAFAYVCVGHAMGMQLIGATEPDDVVMAKLEEAFGNFETARRLDPFDATACGCLVYWFTIVGRLDEAQAEAEYGLTLNPSNHVLRRAYGMYLLARGRNDEALDNMKRALRLNPQGSDTLDTYAHLATAMLTNQDIDQGVRYARQAVLQDPSNPAYQTQLVVALYLQGNEAEAGKALTKAMERIPGLKPDTVWNRGWLKPLKRLMQERLAADGKSGGGDTRELLKAIFAKVGYPQRSAPGDSLITG